MLLALVATLGCRGADRWPEGAEVLEPPLTRFEVLGAEYPTDLVEAGRIRLESGMFRATVDAERGEEVGAQVLEPLAFGTLADGRPAAAVVLVMSGGGSGTFSWLYLTGRTAGEVRPLADAYLGDRVELTALRLAGDTVVVTLVTQGPDDPMCCPTLVVERRFVYGGIRLRGEK
jgi:hypothetical protein